MEFDHSKQISMLKLDRKSISNIHLLAKWLKNTSCVDVLVHAVDLSHNQIKDGSSLAEALKFNTTLKALCLHGNHIVVCGEKRT